MFVARKQSDDFNWEAFSGRALAFLCLHFAEMDTKTVLEKADFLVGLGLPRREAAAILGTTEKSLAELARQKAKRSGDSGKPGGKVGKASGKS